MDQYLVFGNPIAHSKSPLIHSMFAEQTGQQLNYQTQLVDVDGFAEAAATFFSGGGKGCNITMPFKLDAFKFAEQLTEQAKLAGAVNTLYIKESKILGDTTDGKGLVNDLIANQFPIKDKRLLIVGAGGATRGCLLPLLEQQPASISIANRTVSKAQLLADVFSEYGEVTALTLEEVDSGYDVIINATSSGLDGNIPAISSQCITSDSYCYDMLYSKIDTPFVSWCKQFGAKKVIDGLGMLVGQAAESFYIWRGVRPETESVLKRLRAEI